MSTKPLRVGVWDTYFVRTQSSLTKYRQCPDSFIWIPEESDPEKVDVVMATQNPQSIDALLRFAKNHPRKIVYLQETAEVHHNHDFASYVQFDLVLTNHKYTVENDQLRGKTIYTALFGDWILDRNIPPKTKLCSMLATNNSWISGHKMRQSVYKEAIPGVDVMGPITGSPFIEPTELAYHPYFFNIAIENSRYPWWHTEKLFNCFASKTIPIYWGCDNYEKLREWGFDPCGIIPWDGNLDFLREHIADLAKGPEDYYEAFHDSIERNFARSAELSTHEYTLEPMIRNFFGLNG